MWVRKNLDSDKRPIDEAYTLLEKHLLPIFPGQKMTVNVLKDWL